MLLRPTKELFYDPVVNKAFRTKEQYDQFVQRFKRMGTKVEHYVEREAYDQLDKEAQRLSGENERLRESLKACMNSRENLSKVEK